MITAAVSALLGIVGGLVPDSVQWFKERSDHKWELERMREESEIHLKLADQKTSLRLSEIGAEERMLSEKSYSIQLQNLQAIGSKQVNIRWIDGFNALIRPTTATLVMLMFIVIAGMYSWSVLELVSNGTLDMQTAATVLWASLVGESIQAVLGYLFGYRSSRAAAAIGRGI